MAEKSKSKKRYDRLKAEGVCVVCGKRNAAEDHVTCYSCFDKAKQRRKGRPKEIQMVCHPDTLTGDQYRTKDGRIGTISPCAGNDPIVLKFPDGISQVFHAKEIELVRR